MLLPLHGCDACLIMTKTPKTVGLYLGSSVTFTRRHWGKECWEVYCVYINPRWISLHCNPGQSESMFSFPWRNVCGNPTDSDLWGSECLLNISHTHLATLLYAYKGLLCEINILASPQWLHLEMASYSQKDFTDKEITARSNTAT